jgi:hypothetical protein
MIRQFVLSSSMAALIVLGAPSLAHAAYGPWWSWGGDDDHDGKSDRDEKRAPEPVTVIGLALGVGGIAAARWAVGRRSARKR